MRKVARLGLKLGHDLTNQAARFHQEFRGMPPPPGGENAEEDYLFELVNEISAQLQEQIEFHPGLNFEIRNINRFHVTSRRGSHIGVPKQNKKR